MNEKNKKRVDYLIKKLTGDILRVETPETLLKMGVYPYDMNVLTVRRTNDKRNN